MTRVDQLRQALERPPFAFRKSDDDKQRVVLDAARFALRVWEGDEQLAEKVAKAISTFLTGSNLSQFADVAMARAVLAAITEEESSIDLISFNELDQGMKEALSRCKPCGGSGWRRYRDSQPIASDTYPCPDCGGTRRVSQ